MDGVVVITGGTRGIGAATASRLAARGTNLVLGFRSAADAAERLRAELAPMAMVRTVRADIATDEGVEAVFAAADDAGPLVGLVNNAATLEKQGRFETLDRERWRRVFELNVFGTAMCCQEAVRRMKHSGAIVNVSSRAAVLGSPGEYVDYAASKAAVDTLTRGLALEVAERGIRVNAVRPGIIDTEMHALGGDPTRAERLGPGQPMGRVGTADEVAAAIEWLLSDDASYVTGTTLDVSGGR